MKTKLISILFLLAFLIPYNSDSSFCIEMQGISNKDSYNENVVNPALSIPDKFNLFTYTEHPLFINTFNQNTVATSSSSVVVFTGEGPSDYFGNDVSSAGDVNNDGYDDIIIGASQYGLTTETGKAYLFLGGTVVDNVPDVIFKGWNPQALFGIAVCSIGDINNDGYSDILIGEPYKSTIENERGCAYIYFGGASMDTTADVILNGPLPGNHFGMRVAPAGDVNGDSIPDMIIWGEAYNNGPLLSAGAIFIYYGGNPMDTIPDVKISGHIIDEHLGEKAAGVGDINKDGYDDVLVGNAYSSIYIFHLHTGRAKLFFGGPSMDSTADMIFNGEAPGDRFGHGVASADVNGDTWLDLIIGAKTNDAGGVDAGKVYIYNGGANMDTIPDILLTGFYPNENFYYISSAGDQNTDGFEDVLVGTAYPYNSRAYIYYGGEPMNNFADVILTGEASGDLFGNYLALAGDVNGDTLPDVLLSAIYNDAGGTNAGRAYLYSPAITWIEVTNIYGQGQVPLQSSFPDTVGIRLQKNVSATLPLEVGLQIKNLEFPFDVRFDTSIFSPEFNVTDTIIYFICAPAPFPRHDIIIVQALPGELLNASLDAYDTNTFCFSTTINSYSYSEPCKGADGGAGFDSRRGSFAVRFRNFENDTISVSSINYSVMDFTGSGNKLFKLVVYDDDGGKPGSLLYSSPEIISPPGGSQVYLNFIIEPPVSITGNSFFYAGYEQTTDSNIRVSFQYEIPIRSNSFFFRNVSDVDWSDFHDSLKYFRLDISPIVNGRLLLRAYLEGFYNGIKMIPDTVTLFVRSFNSPYNMIDNSVSRLDTAGIGVFNFSKINTTAEYYFVLKHRNHIETWSHQVGERFNIPNKEYDFTNDTTKAFGNNLKQVGVSPVRCVIYGGDINQDGVVDATDAGEVDNDAFNFVSGYFNTDLNGDLVTDATDAALADNNVFNFVSAVVP